MGPLLGLPCILPLQTPTRPQLTTVGYDEVQHYKLHTGLSVSQSTLGNLDQPCLALDSLITFEGVVPQFNSISTNIQPVAYQ